MLRVGPSVGCCEAAIFPESEADRTRRSHREKRRSWPIATLPQEFMSAMQPKADKPELTRMTRSRPGRWTPAAMKRKSPGLAPRAVLILNDRSVVAPADRA